MKMLKVFAVLAIAALMVSALAGIASAKDVVLENTIESKTLATGSDGNEYIRFIVNEKRELSGVTYDAGVAVMVFSGSAPEVFEQAKAMNPGDKIRAIAEQREYQGRTSYTIRQFLGSGE